MICSNFFWDKIAFRVFNSSTLSKKEISRFFVNIAYVVVVVVVRAAPNIPEMSIPGVGYSFKPKGLAFVTPLYPVSQTD